MDKLIWSGPRESDISGLEDIFCASATIFGSNENGNDSYSKTYKRRIDHNNPECITDSFIVDMIGKRLEQYPDAKIMYYNPIFSKYLPDKYRDRVVCHNDISILEFLDSKCEVRQMASRMIPVVPFQKIDSIDLLKKLMSDLQNGRRYILQENHSSGGYGTHIVDKFNVEKAIASFNPQTGGFISPYFENSYSVNAHCIVFSDHSLILPGSIQIVKESDEKIIYMGSDFTAYNSLPTEITEQVKSNSEKIGEKLRTMGYRGVMGIDYLVVDNTVSLLEINARFQASTPLINRALICGGHPSVQELNYLAFNNQVYLNEKEIETINVPYSMAVYNTETWKKDLNVLKACDSEINAVELNGFDSYEDTEKGSYLFHIVFRTNICSVSPDGALWVYENLFDICTDFSDGIIKKEPLNVKISLLNQGLIIEDEAKEYLATLGEVRHAVFSAFDITIFNDLHINCPSDVKFISFTPWRIKLSRKQELQLFYRTCFISNVSLDMADVYAKRCTSSGLPYEMVSFWATDRMRIHHTISCVFKKNDRGCRFCEVPKLAAKYDVNDIFEIIDFYLDNANNFRHFLVGGGSESIWQEENHIAEIVEHIRKKCDKPIYLMCLPPEKPTTLKHWHQSGITEVAFNIEIFDRKLAEKYMPGKGRIPLSQYINALKNATDIWGKTGNVRTLFIVGLEQRKTLIEGVKTVSALGVMPVLSIFRALKGTETQDIVPPPNEWLMEIYNECEEICRHNNLHLGPVCPACQNNTLSLPFDML